MKRILATGIVLGVFAIPSLCAAHENFKGEATPPAGHCWTGMYLGGNLGGKWGKFIESVRTDTASLPAAAITIPAETVSFNSTPASPVGGVQMGYNLQYQSLLLGGEADLNAMRLSEEKIIGPGFKSDIYVPGDSIRTRSDWTYSLRARVGYVWENWLLYLTGGLALTDVKVRADFVQVTDGPLVFPEATGSSSRILLGGTIGAGTEYAFAKHWSVGGEYRYTAYQTKSVHLALNPTIAFPIVGGTGLVYAPVTARVRMYTNEVLFKVNYNFA
jgi:outer membrane immunogenic protein